MTVPKFYLVMLVGILLTGFILRIDGIHRGMEYDEIWPLMVFHDRQAWEVFTVRDEENNFHLINHALAAIAAKNDNFTELNYRRWSLIAGFLLMMGVATLAFVVTQNYACSLFAALFCALDPCLIHYAQIARGYVLQHLFAVLLCLWLFFERLQHRRPVVWNMGLILIAMLLQAAVVTSAIVWFPIFAVFAIDKLWQLRNKRISLRHLFTKAFIPLGICCTILGSWLVWILPCLSVGTQHTVDVHQPIIVQTIITIQSLTYWPLHILWISGLFVYYRHRFTRVIIALVITIMAFGGITGLLGPARVYSYLLPFCFISAGIALNYFLKLLLPHKRIPPLVLFVVCMGIVALSSVYLHSAKDKWQQVDYKHLVPKLMEKFPHGYFLFDAHSGMRVRYYYLDEINQRNFQALHQQSKSLDIWLINQNKRLPQISVCDIAGSNVQKFSLSPTSIVEQVIIDGIRNCRLQSLPRLQAMPSSPNGLLFATVTKNRSGYYNWRKHFIKQQQKIWFVANIWCTAPVPVMMKNRQRLLIAYLLCAHINSPADWRQAQLALPSTGVTYYWLSH